MPPESLEVYTLRSSWNDPQLRRWRSLLDILTAYILDNDLDLTGKTALYLDEELSICQN